MALAPASRAGGPYLSSIGRVLPGVRNEPQQDFADFQQRLPTHLKRLDVLDVNYYKPKP